jgi:hypothetical protein
LPYALQLLQKRLKDKILAVTKKYICGKATRELVQGSVEVFPIPGYGAVETGLHKFHNKQQNNVTSKPCRFVIVWKTTMSGG